MQKRTRKTRANPHPISGNLKTHAQNTRTPARDTRNPARVLALPKNTRATHARVLAREKRGFFSYPDFSP